MESIWWDFRIWLSFLILRGIPIGRIEMARSERLPLELREAEMLVNFGRISEARSVLSEYILSYPDCEQAEWMLAFLPGATANQHGSRIERSTMPFEHSKGMRDNKNHPRNIAPKIGIVTGSAAMALSWVIDARLIDTPPVPQSMLAIGALIGLLCVAVSAMCLRRA